MRPGPLVGAVPAPALHVMTYNIRRRMPALLSLPSDHWERRAPLMDRLLAAERPSVLCVQEALPDQARRVLSALGDGYRMIGRGRDAGGRGEGCPVFYDADRLELRSWSQTALSDRPAEAGSLSWGNPVPRIVVDAVLHDVAAGADLRVLNTHLDPLSARSRVRSALHLRAMAARSAEPVVLTGDANAGPHSPAADALFEGGTLRDAWPIAERRLTPEWDTFGGYRTPRERGRRIDWIAVSRGVAVERIGIHGRTVEGGWPSDHLPVQAVLHLTGGTS